MVQEKEPVGPEEPVIGPSMPEVEPAPVVDARALPSLRGHELPSARGKRPRAPETGFVPVEVISDGGFH